MEKPKDHEDRQIRAERGADPALQGAFLQLWITFSLLLSPSKQREGVGRRPRAGRSKDALGGPESLRAKPRAGLSTSLPGPTRRARLVATALILGTVQQPGHVPVRICRRAVTCKVVFTQLMSLQQDVSLPETRQPPPGIRYPTLPSLLSVNHD